VEWAFSRTDIARAAIIEAASGSGGGLPARLRIVRSNFSSRRPGNPRSFFRTTSRKYSRSPAGVDGICCAGRTGPFRTLIHCHPPIARNAAITHTPTTTRAPMVAHRRGALASIYRCKAVGYLDSGDRRDHRPDHGLRTPGDREQKSATRSERRMSNVQRPTPNGRQKT
jgi:hypothetical protein